MSTLPIVRYDADRSTPWTQIYHTRSDSSPTTTHETTHDPRTGEWRCTCVARARCKHIVRAELYALRRQWEPLLADYTPEMLRSLIADKAMLERTDLADAWDRAGRDTAEKLLAAREGRAA